MRVVYVYADSASEWNCSEWRQLAVSDAINAAVEKGILKDWHAKMVHVSGFLSYLDPSIQDLVMPADLICFQRNLITEHVFNSIRYFQGMGKVFCADLDDAYNMLPWSNPAHAFWVRNSSNLDPPPLDMLERGLKLCGALTAPNKLLLQNWSHVARGYYIQNYARGEWWKPEVDRAGEREKRGLTGKIVIGWGGSVSHYDSWWGCGLREAAERICKRHRNVVFMVCGNDPRIHAQLPVPFDQKFNQPGVPPQEWPGIVKLFDIGVAPLYGFYDQHRSWIKGMEYQLAGIPWVGAAGVPYQDMAQYGTLVPDGVDEWEMALEVNIAHLERETEAAKARVEPAQQEYLIENNLDVIEGTYKQIINDIRMDTGVLPSVFHVIDGKVTTVPQ